MFIHEEGINDSLAFNEFEIKTYGINSKTTIDQLKSYFEFSNNKNNNNWWNKLIHLKG